MQQHKRVHYCTVCWVSTVIKLIWWVYLPFLCVCKLWITRTNAQAYCIQLKHNCLNKFSHNYHSFQFRKAFTETTSTFLPFLVYCRVYVKTKCFSVKKTLSFARYFKPDWNWFEKFSIDCIQLERLTLSLFLSFSIYIIYI